MKNSNQESNDNANPIEITLLAIIESLMVVMKPAENDVMALIAQVDKKSYKEIREEVNKSFVIGEVDKFTGIVEEDTEFGDITDLIQGVLHERYPIDKVKGKVHTTMLSIKERTEWRDQLITALDLMVEE